MIEKDDEYEKKKTQTKISDSVCKDLKDKNTSSKYHLLYPHRNESYISLEQHEDDKMMIELFKYCLNNIIVLTDILNEL